jgi:hypothetical protein
MYIYIYSVCHLCNFSFDFVLTRETVYKGGVVRVCISILILLMHVENQIRIDFIVSYLLFILIKTKAI